MRAHDWKYLAHVDLYECRHCGLRLTPPVQADAPKFCGCEVRVVDPQTGGAKGSKPERVDQLPASALLEVGRVAGYGLGKYGQGNASRGYAYSLSLAALHRHVLAWQDGEDRDPETGLHHLAHAAWHCLTLIAFQVHTLGTDDRGGKRDE